MTFDPNTIEHLGVRMYSTFPPVLAELIANAYDADATNVTLTLNDENEEKEIVVEDDGTGMSFDEINDKFLRIGRNRRLEDDADSTLKGRKIIGKKGLGKLSFFGVAHEIEIATKKNGEENVFRMKWEDIKKEQMVYKPEIVRAGATCSPHERGTTIVLRKLRRLTKFNPERIATSLSRIFIVDLDFKVTIKHNSSEPIVVSNERRFADLEKQVEWNMPTDNPNRDAYEKANQIVGHLIATNKPIPANTNMRGIALFSRKKLVNAPGYFSDSTSSHFYSYITGWLEVDFIDDLEDDVIATNRQSLNWEHEEMVRLQSHLRDLINWLQTDWRERRNEIRREKITQATGIHIPDWFKNVSDDVRKKLESVIITISNDAELSEESHNRAVKNIYDIVPEYPNYHWRRLHPEVKDASQTDYEKEDYYRAFQEAAKRYIHAVEKKSEIEEGSAAGKMGSIFGSTAKSMLQVVQHYKKPDGEDFHPTTIADIEEGQKFLSMGIVSGYRNPFSHEEVADLRDSNLFTEQDCLDALSLLSHLFHRLDGSQKKT